MRKTITIEVDAQHETLVRGAIALAEELQQLALTAPEGTVFDACEKAIVQKGRDLQAQFLSAVVARRIQTAEKKGRRCDNAPAVV